MKKISETEITNLVTTLTHEISDKNLLKMVKRIEDEARNMKNDNEAMLMVLAEIYGQCQDNMMELLIEVLKALIVEKKGKSNEK